MQHVIKKKKKRGLWPKLAIRHGHPTDANWALGRLDGIATVLPNPDLFVSMYVRQEAVLSSQIEGTQSTLEDVLQFEIDSKGQDFPKDIQEVVNYVGAMNYGLDRLKTLPLSLRLIREIHTKLLAGVRGSNRTPGEFRASQNWIGPNGCTLANATFVPPPVPEMQTALGNFRSPDMVCRKPVRFLFQNAGARPNNTLEAECPGTACVFY
jgi:Fic family protein